jgi:two-component system sensor histidine kinase RegB
MGTPLSTMAVVIGELRHDLPEDQAGLRDSLTILDEQVRGCKRILDKILSSAQDDGGMALQSVDGLMNEVLNEWQLLRPTAKYQYSSYEAGLADDLHKGTPEGGATPQLNVDTTLRAALMNLLNNAADASPQGIEIISRCDAAHFILTVLDHGAGLSEEAARKAGSAFFTTKREGRGLGLLLANATVERLGGTVRLTNNPQGGASTELTLPLAGVRA